MLSSFYSGISGLMANNQAITVVGNNIANVNTIAYKGSKASFEDVLYQSILGSAGTSQVGRGTALSCVDGNFAQGSFESTSEATDLAIGGSGFFIVRSPENDRIYYTRAGQFRFDKDGNLTTPAGYILQGKEIDRTVVPPSAAGVNKDVIVSPEPSAPKATTQIGMAVNLLSNAPCKATVKDLSAGIISKVELSSGKYARAGNYEAKITKRQASHTGTNAVDFGTSGLTDKIIINGQSIDVSGISTMAALATKINTNMTATNTKVTAAATTDGKLTLSATTPGVDITIDTSQISGGDIGWTAEDIASKELYGANLALTVTTLLDGVEQPDYSKTFTNNILTTGGTITNFSDTTGVSSGLDITYGAITSDSSTQTFNISGFTGKTESSTYNPTTTSNYSSAITVYDSLGLPHVVTIYFRKSHEEGTDQVWEWHAHLGSADSATGEETIVKSGYLVFNTSGVLTSGGDPIPIDFTFAQQAAPQQIYLVMGSTSGGGSSTQYPIASTTNYQAQDGYPPGVLMEVTVNQDGVMSGHYSNGQILDLYQIVLADFNNPRALSREGGNLYAETLETGKPKTGMPGEGALGKINPNSLEQSNVDLASEFVKLIVAQRGFQANSRVITTTDEILQELMNLKR